MVTFSVIQKYFPDLNPEQIKALSALQDLYAEENSKVNLISRKDFDNFYLHHVLHSLALVKFCGILPGQRVVDIGTGGGFPGIPLAIFYPETTFVLCDSIGKKIRAVQAVIDALQLTNASAVNSRTETLPGKFDIAVARAVAPMSELHGWMQQKWKNKVCFYLLKGGDLTEEMNDLLQIQPGLKIKQFPIASAFAEDFFETKKVIQVTS